MFDRARRVCSKDRLLQLQAYKQVVKLAHAYHMYMYIMYMCDPMYVVSVKSTRIVAVHKECVCVRACVCVRV